MSEQLATVSDKTPISQLFSSINRVVYRNGKKFRGMDVIGKDNVLLQAISDPMFNASSFTNKALQEKLLGTEWTSFT